jgi:hypothetical protein
MASVGHWKNLAEAERLTQAHLVAGIVEEDIQMGGLIPRLPLAQFSGLEAKWNREKTLPTGQQASIGATLTWQEAAEVDPRNTGLKITYVQTVLNHFVSEVYGNINNYQAVQLMQDKKAMLKKIEDLVLYGDLTYSAGSLDFDGLHALCENSGTNFNSDSIDVDMLEAGLSLKTLRDTEDRMLHGVDAWLFPKVIANRLDAYTQEAGLSTNTFGALGFGMDDLGKHVTRWNGKEIIRSDFLVAEQANTGVGSDARGKYTSGDKQYSIFALKFGQVMAAEPGLTLAWGTQGGAEGQLWKQVFFPNLEDFDAAGIRLVTYMGLLDGSTVAAARIYDIEDVAVVA